MEKPVTPVPASFPVDFDPNALDTALLSDVEVVMQREDVPTYTKTDLKNLLNIDKYQHMIPGWYHFWEVDLPERVTKLIASKMGPFRVDFQLNRAVGKGDVAAVRRLVPYGSEDGLLLASFQDPYLEKNKAGTEAAKEALLELTENQ